MMDFKRLSEYKGKGNNLLFYLPLYIKIKIELDLRIKNDIEILDCGYEDERPHSVEHTLFHENSDFVFLKSLLSAEIKIYNYCPYCQKDIILKSKYRDLPDEMKKSFLSQDTNIDSEEAYNACINYAYKNFMERYNYLTENLLDSNRNFIIELECTSRKNIKCK